MFFRSLMLFWSLVLSAPLVQSVPHEPLLAEGYRQGLELEQWWVSEKLDGVRAIWDGEQLYFRSGRPIRAPAWYTRDFPAQPMDGELWMGRNRFDPLSAAVRRSEPDAQEWGEIQYRLFELPEADGSFTQRIEQMERLTRQAGVAWLQPVEQFRVGSEAELLATLDQIVAAGGEGLMLHRAAAHYHGGRSGDLLKLKRWQDAEAVVVEILPGKGKYAGVMGALLVEDQQGRRFRIGSGFSDRQRQQPPPPGSVITYKYTGQSANGLPRFASFLRLRPQ
jgi:DNA ligase-1